MERFNNKFDALEAIRKWDEEEGRFDRGSTVIAALMCGWVMGSGLVTALLYWISSGSSY